MQSPTAVERELVLRLASLLWRLHRATAIETGLFQIQNDSSGDLAKPQPREHGLNAMVRTAGLESAMRPDSWNGNHWDNRFANGNNACDGADVLALEPEFNIDISRRFLRFRGTSRRQIEVVDATAKVG